MAKFELGQKLNLKWMDLIVPSVITKRIKVEDIDSGEYEIYYDYKHDLPSGSTFPKVPEEHLAEMYRKALRETVEKIVGKGD